MDTERYSKPQRRRKPMHRITTRQQLKKQQGKKQEVTEKEQTQRNNTQKSRRQRARDLSRLLKLDLPQRQRQLHEQELEAIEGEQSQKRRDEQKEKTIKRYHMVRFFERQKATRYLKKARKAFDTADTPETRESASQAVHDADVELNYTLYYPLEIPYSGLYPRGPVPQKTTEMKLVVEAAMANGTLDQLRNSPHLSPSEPDTSIKQNDSHDRTLSGELKGRQDDSDGIEEEDGTAFFDK